MSMPFVVSKEKEFTMYAPFKISATGYVDVGDKKVVYFETTSSDDNLCSVVVPGVVIRNEYKGRFDNPTVDVDPITDFDFRSQVRAALKAENKKIHFWSLV